MKNCLCWSDSSIEGSKPRAPNAARRRFCSLSVSWKAWLKAGCWPTLCTCEGNDFMALGFYRCRQGRGPILLKQRDSNHSCQKSSLNQRCLFTASETLRLFLSLFQCLLNKGYSPDRPLWFHCSVFWSPRCETCCNPARLILLCKVNWVQEESKLHPALIAFSLTDSSSP